MTLIPLANITGCAPTKTDYAIPAALEEFQLQRHFLTLTEYYLGAAVTLGVLTPILYGLPAVEIKPETVIA